MKLIQIHNFNLFYHIKDCKVDINQSLDKYQVNSSYITGDYRTSKNQIKNTVFKITGIIESQHLIHSLQSIQENDEELGLTKCFFIEEYEIKDDNHRPKKQFKIHFQYCYIDIVAINQVSGCSDNDYYNVDFELSLKFNQVYDITNSKNTYFVTDTILKDNNLNLYDTFKQYDLGNKYDTFLSSIQTNSLFNQQNNLNIWQKKITCCDEIEHTYIYHIDTVIRPFIEDNASSRAGLITNYIDNSVFTYDDEKKNFLQVYLSNPYNNLLKISNSVESPISLPRQGNSATITNLDKSTNTYSTNAIIQIFNANYNLGSDQLLTGNLNNLFTANNQKIRLQIKSDKKEISNLSIQCTSSFILNNLKMLIIHPHRQLIYGVFDTITGTFTSNYFDFDDLFKVVNLENYMLQNYIKVQNDNLEGVQNWFRLSPRYTHSIYTKKGSDSIKLSTEFQNSNQQIASNTAIVCQIYSLDENNLI